MNGSTTSRTSRGLPHAARDDHSQVLPTPVAQGAEEALHGAPRQTRQTLEILRLPDVQERKFWGDYMHAFEEAILGYGVEPRTVVRGAS